MSDGTPGDVSNGEAPAGAAVVTMDPLKPLSFKERMCPILSAPMFSPGQEATQVCACKGPLCMFFVPIVELSPDGKQTMKDGQCAVALIPTGLSHLKDTAIALEQQRLQIMANGGRVQLAGPGNPIRKR
jgi:hypothetical protein